MRKTRIASPCTMQSKPVNTSDSEMDYSPKTNSLRDQIIFGIKLFAACGAFFLLLWLYEKF
jgi:hypothetical protein